MTADKPSGAWGDEKTKFFFELTPDRVLEAVESSGLVCTGRCQALNSFENRVYDVELESDGSSQSGPISRSRRVAKFYRPGRWSEAQILEEHQFLGDLVNAEIPAVAPLAFGDGKTLHQTRNSGIWFAIFPKVGGRSPDELDDQQLRQIGRLLARIHGVGASRAAPHRLKIGVDTYGEANLAFLLEGRWIPAEFLERYESAARAILSLSAPLLAGAHVHRIHGDCHFGNLLWNQSGPFFVDFDDMLNGPAVQDLWLLAAGRDEEAFRQRGILLEGYEEMREFDRATLRLIEPLRSLRFIHYTAWIARRWEDPAFPAAFPQFGTHRYWADETNDLEKQLSLIRQNPV